jgi:hypothetical protein
VKDATAASVTSASSQVTLTAFAAVESAGCIAVNGGTWNSSQSGTGTILIAFNAYEFSPGDVINISLSNTFTVLPGSGAFDIYNATGSQPVVFQLFAFNQTIQGSYTINTTDGTNLYAELSATTGTGGTATDGSVVTCNSVVPTTPTISPSSVTIDSGESVTFSSTWSDGKADYSATLYSGSNATCSSDTTVVQTLAGLTTGSATFTAVSPTSNTYYCVVVTDAALATVSSTTSLVTVN